MTEIIYTNKEYLYSYNLAVAAVSYEKKYLTTTVGFTLKQSEEFVSYIIENDLPQYLAVDDDVVVGWCDIIPRDGEFFKHIGILGIGLLPEFRGKGLGKRLLEKTIEKAVVAGLFKIELEVFASNTVAQKMYQSFGFEIEGTRHAGKKFNNQYEDVVLMGKIL